MTNLTAFPIPTQIVDIQEQPKAAALPKARLNSPRIAPGWLDLGAMFFGQISEIPDFIPIPEGWWEWAAPASGLRKITNWSPEALRRGTRDVRDVTVDPLRLFSDTAGTTLISGPGAEVAAMRDSRGVMVATQTTFGARLKFAIQPAIGLRNRLLNNRNDAAVVGVLGSGGVLPTGYAVTTSGATVEVVSLAFVGGRQNFRVKVSGTPSGNITFRTSAIATIAALTGQTWARSTFLSIAAGDLTGFSGINHGARNYTSAAVNHSFKGGTITVTGTPTRFSAASAIADADGTGVIASIAQEISLLWTSGAVDITLDISLPQMEQAGAATDVQITGANGFDVTEAGRRSIHQLAWDATDDVMNFESDFDPAGAYLLAASRAPASGFPGTVTFDGSPPGALFVQSIATQLSADGSGNSASFQPAGWPSGLVGVRRLDMIRVNAAGDAQAWRNGVLATTGITLAGDMIPLAAINRLGRAGSSGRFSGGLLLDEGDTSLTEAELLMTERYLAYNGGITL